MHEPCGRSSVFETRGDVNAAVIAKHSGDDVGSRGRRDRPAPSTCLDRRDGPKIDPPRTHGGWGHAVSGDTAAAVASRWRCSCVRSNGRVVHPKRHCRGSNAAGGISSGTKCRRRAPSDAVAQNAAFSPHAFDAALPTVVIVGFQILACVRAKSESRTTATASRALQGPRACVAAASAVVLVGLEVTTNPEEMRGPRGAAVEAGITRRGANIATSALTNGKLGFGDVLLRADAIGIIGICGRTAQRHAEASAKNRHDRRGDEREEMLTVHGFNHPLGNPSSCPCRGGLES